jgi:hypothetical protein
LHVQLFPWQFLCKLKLEYHCSHLFLSSN